jgi:hypothetical protein
VEALMTRMILGGGGLVRRGELLRLPEEERTRFSSGDHVPAAAKKAAAAATNLSEKDPGLSLSALRRSTDDVALDAAIGHGEEAAECRPPAPALLQLVFPVLENVGDFAPARYARRLPVRAGGALGRALSIKRPGSALHPAAIRRLSL